MGVAAIEMRTGKVLWEAWRSDEISDGVSKATRAAVKSLLPRAEKDRRSDPDVPHLPTASAEGLVIENPWPRRIGLSAPTLSLGKSLMYYQQAEGVIALDRRTKKEVWRLSTSRFPDGSTVREADGLVFVQIGSNVPRTIRAVLLGGRDALPKLGRVTPHRLVAGAILLHHFGDGYLRPELRKHLERLRKVEEEPDPQAAANAIEKLLASWPKKRDDRRLLDGCVAALLRPDERVPLPEFAWRGTQRTVAWCLLQELIYGYPPDGYDRPGLNYAYRYWKENPLSLSDEAKAKLVALSRRVLAEGPEAERPFAASVLVSNAVGWDRITDAERKELLLSAQPSVWRWAAMSLVKNGRREQLIAWAVERPVGDHLDIVWILTHEKPKEWSAAELRFWLACARRAPGSIAYVLKASTDDPAPKVFRGQVRSYLEKEIAEPIFKDGNRQGGSELFAAVFLLDRWKNKNDTPLLLKYLHHPYRVESLRLPGFDSPSIRDYRLRGYVKGMLENRGIKVPEGIVYQEEIEERNE